MPERSASALRCRLATFGSTPCCISPMRIRASLRASPAATSSALPIRTRDIGPPGMRLRTDQAADVRSEEHTSELQSLMRISYAVFCLKKKKHTKQVTIKYKHYKEIQQPQITQPNKKA